MNTQGERVALAIGLLLLFLLIAASFVIMRPFLAALLWGLILSVATWPAFRWFRRVLRGSRTWAAAVMTLLLALVLLGPLVIVGGVLADNIAILAETVRSWLQEGPPEPPALITDLPIVGPRLTAYWRELAEGGVKLAETVRTAIGPVTRWLLAIVGALGGGIAELSLSVLCAFFFYRDGEAGLRRLNDILQHLAGDRARRLIDVAHGTLKGVVYGVLGAAVAQGVLAGLGFWMAGAPAPFFLGVLVCFLGIIPGGPAVVWLPATIWVFHAGDTAWGIFLLLWNAVLVGNIDNVIKPYFISRGSALPLLLVLFGVVGGALAFGFLEIFLGPTVLAILYTLMREWSPQEIARSNVVGSGKIAAS